MAKIVDEDSPTFGQAQMRADWPQFEDAIKAELDKCVENEVFDYIAFRDIPRSATLLPTKFVLTVKYDSLGAYVKHKARLVALGNLEKYQSRHTYAPTSHFRTFQLWLTICVARNLKIGGLDIESAFLSATINRDVYISFPATRGQDKTYAKLKKTLYGLSDSPRMFYDKLVACLIKAGFCVSQHDTCLIYRTCNMGFFIAVIHVDDFAFGYSTEAILEYFFVIAEVRVCDQSRITNVSLPWNEVNISE